MKRFPLILIISLLLIVSCQKTDNSSSALKLDPNTKQILFYSDEKNIQDEDSYYDALLEIKKLYPHAISNITVISSSENRGLGKYEIDHFPALMVVYKNQILIKLIGNRNKQEIVDSITKALSNHPNP